MRVNPDAMPSDDADRIGQGITIRHGESVITLPARSSAEAVADLVKALNRHTDGVGRMAASWLESRRQRHRANTGSKISGGFTVLPMPRSEKAEFPIRKQGKVFPILRKTY